MLSFKTNKYIEPRQELIRAEPSFEPSPALSHDPRGEPSIDPMIVGCIFTRRPYLQYCKLLLKF